eukprot:4456946-Pyramimonas_sp.AAC.1
MCVCVCIRGRRDVALAVEGAFLPYIAHVMPLVQEAMRASRASPAPHIITSLQHVLHSALKGWFHLPKSSVRCSLAHLLLTLLPLSNNIAATYSPRTLTEWRRDGGRHWGDRHRLMLGLVGLTQVDVRGDGPPGCSVHPCNTTHRMMLGVVGLRGARCTLVTQHTG